MPDRRHSEPEDRGPSLKRRRPLSCRGEAIRPVLDRFGAEWSSTSFRIGEEPYYRAVGDEVRLFTAAYAERMPIMLKGPTGCGKTRFVEYMAWSSQAPSCGRSPAMRT